jgi:hypothetical protein
MSRKPLPIRVPGVHFCKIFSSMLNSSVWRQETANTRCLWLTMLMLKDSYGYVFNTIPGLAAEANIPVEDCEIGLQRLMTPDKYSQSKAHEGRRLIETEGGWIVINHDKYRELRTDEAQRERWMIQKRNQRARQKKYIPPKGHGPSGREMRFCQAESEAEQDRIAAEGLPPATTQTPAPDNPRPTSGAGIDGEGLI